MDRIWFRRLAATGAALSVGSLAFLYGCNHDNDACDTCPNEHVHVIHSADANTVEPAQATAYEGPEINLQNDTYYRQHRLDRDFDRAAYLRDRAAYVRERQGDLWWNDHRVELEGNRGASPSVNVDVALDNDPYFIEHGRDAGFDRDAYQRDRAAYVRTHEGDAYWNSHRAEYERNWSNRRDNRDYDQNMNTSVEKKQGFDREINAVQHPNDATVRNNNGSKLNETSSSKAQSRDSNRAPTTEGRAEERTNKVDESSSSRAQSRDINREPSKGERVETSSNKADETGSSKAQSRDFSTSAHENEQGAKTKTEGDR